MAKDSAFPVLRSKSLRRYVSSFKVLPRVEDAGLSDVRELHGYTPWYFDLPIPGMGYEDAWQQLMDPEGFYAPYGPTTAEQRHPQFSLSYQGHACQWNGPSWPFATSVTLTAMANLLPETRKLPSLALTISSSSETTQNHTV